MKRLVPSERQLLLVRREMLRQYGWEWRDGYWCLYDDGEDEPPVRFRSSREAFECMEAQEQDEEDDDLPAFCEYMDGTRVYLDYGDGNE